MHKSNSSHSRIYEKFTSHIKQSKPRKKFKTLITVMSIPHLHQLVFQEEHLFKQNIELLKIIISSKNEFIYLNSQSGTLMISIVQI